MDKSRYGMKMENVIELTDQLLNVPMELKSGISMDKGGLPAVENTDGQNRQWWVNGQLHRDGGLPAIEDDSGTKKWYINGKLSRNNDLPAIEGINGYKSWFFNGLRHRETGPAIIYCVDGHTPWYIHGRALTSTQTSDYVAFCHKMQEKRRVRAQKKIYFWWIQICYDLDHKSGCGQRMANLNLAEYETMVKDN